MWVLPLPLSHNSPGKVSNVESEYSCSFPRWKFHVLPTWTSCWWPPHGEVLVASPPKEWGLWWSSPGLAFAPGLCRWGWKYASQDQANTQEKPEEFGDWCRGGLGEPWKRSRVARWERLGTRVSKWVGRLLGRSQSFSSSEISFLFIICCHQPLLVPLLFLLAWGAGVAWVSFGH